jgi:hypothetical protein
MTIRQEIELERRKKNADIIRDMSMVLNRLKAEYGDNGHLNDQIGDTLAYINGTYTLLANEVEDFIQELE